MIVLVLLKVFAMTLQLYLLL